MLLAIVVVVLGLGALREWLIGLTPVFAAVYLTGVLMAWRFHRSRLLLALVLLALADRILFHFAGAEAMAAPAGRAVFNGVALLVPVHLIALALLPERGPFTLRGLARWTGLAVEIAILFQLIQAWPDTLASVFAGPDFARTYFEWTNLPPLAGAAFVVAFVLFVARLLQQPRGERRALVWALIAAFLAVNQGEGGLISTTYFATAGLVILVTVMQASYTLAYQDGLTGLPARRGFWEALDRVVDRYALAIVDVDHFKKFNDEHGHDVGDQVLRMVAAELQGVTGGGKAFRYGGEEFALLFPGKLADEVQPHLEKMRATIAGRVFTVRGPKRPRKKPEDPKRFAGPRKTLKVTVSIGAADTSLSDYPTHDDVIKAADEELYKAKEAGRNRVRVRTKPKI